VTYYHQTGNSFQSTVEAESTKPSASSSEGDLDPTDASPTITGPSPLPNSTSSPESTSTPPPIRTLPFTPDHSPAQPIEPEEPEEPTQPEQPAEPEEPEPTEPEPTETEPTPTFGVCLQYYGAEESAAYFPDMWTLVKSIGASHIYGAARRWAADEAAQHGIKCIFSYTSPATDPTSMSEYFASSEALIAHLRLYNISQYQDHPGVFGHILTIEPWVNYDFDPLNPDQATLNLIAVLRSGVEYIKSQDPTHPVWVALNPAGTYIEDSAKLYLEKRKAWISLFIDFCDILDYHYYGIGDSGNEWWLNSTEFRQKLVEMLDRVIIPGSKGKPIIIGEMGCPSSQMYDWQQKIVEFNETQQAEYFRIYGEETKARGIFVYVFKLIDATPWSYEDWGLFNTENNGIISIPKLAASLVREYLSIE